MKTKGRYLVVNEEEELMMFDVKLIKVISTEDQKARDDLQSNCAHVTNNLWLFEGDEIALGEGIAFEVVGEAAIESYGDLSSYELKCMVTEKYGVE